jgi:hypothetical protein
MPGKDDFLGNKTLWLDSDSMAVARERFWMAFARGDRLREIKNFGPDRRTWDIAWAAAVAAMSYVMSGSLGPAVDDQPDVP